MPGRLCAGTGQFGLRPAQTPGAPAQAAKLRGVPVFNAPFSNTRSVAELVVGEVIALARQLGDRSAEMHGGTWRKVSRGCYEVRGKTLGIVGYGHIGSQARSRLRLYPIPYTLARTPGCSARFKAGQNMLLVS